MAAIGARLASRFRRRRERSAAPPRDDGRAPGPRAIASIVAAALLVPLGAIAWGRQAGTPAPAPKAPPRRTAADVLARAIAKQGFPKVADPAADLPVALRTKVNLQLRDDRGNDVSIDAERRYLAPNLIFTKAIDRFSRKEVFSGFDGKTPWLYSEETGPVDLNGPERANDLKQLQLDVEMTDTLARAFLLRRLVRELKDAKLLDDLTYVDEKNKTNMTAWVVEGISEIEVERRKKKTVLWLYVEQKEARLMGARVMVEGDPPLQLCFWKHETIGGVDIPRNIKIYRNDAPQPQITISVDELDLAPKLTAADFKPPKK